jgi:hypothetical protein
MANIILSSIAPIKLNVYVVKTNGTQASFCQETPNLNFTQQFQADDWASICWARRCASVRRLMLARASWSCLTRPKHLWRGEVPQRLMIALRIVVLDEARDRRLQLLGEIVVFQADDILNRAMIAFDFALGLRMIGRAANMVQPLFR